MPVYEDYLEWFEVLNDYFYFFAGLEPDDNVLGDLHEFVEPELSLAAANEAVEFLADGDVVATGLLQQQKGYLLYLAVHFHLHLVDVSGEEEDGALEHLLLVAAVGQVLVSPR